MLLQPMSQTDVFYSVDVFFCLPTFTFQLLCFLVLPNYKTQRPSCAEQSSEYLYYSILLLLDHDDHLDQDDPLDHNDHLDHGDHIFYTMMTILP